MGQLETNTDTWCMKTEKRKKSQFLGWSTTFWPKILF